MTGSRVFPGSPGDSDVVDTPSPYFSNKIFNFAKTKTYIQWQR